MEEHSQRLRERIVAELNHTPGKRMTFGRFMELALYDPEGGYYNQPREKIGKQGDFYTSAQIGGIMGEVLARAFLRRVDEQPLTLVEWGAGQGRMAKVVLDSIQQMSPSVYARLRYELVERSPDHRHRQLAELCNHEAKIACYTPEEWWLEGSRQDVIVWANELLDAFPVERIRCLEGRYEQAYVRWDTAAQQFSWLWLEAEGTLIDRLDREYVHLKEGQIADLSPEAESWYERLLTHLERARVILIDYGHEAHELFASHRMNGSLLAYYRHQALDEPLERPGEQDLTAMVNFSAMQRIGEEQGWEVRSLVTQRAFLEQEGILELLQDNLAGNPFDVTGRRNRAIRQLLWSDQMGDVFKVMEHVK
jgi:SAM-dependent MidA family methyltransferase